MNLDLDKLAGRASSAMGVARELARMERERTALRDSLATSAAKQAAAGLAQGGRDLARRATDIAGVHSAAMAVAQQHGELLTGHSAAVIAIKAMQDAERGRAEHMRRMLEPLATIRAGLAADGVTQRLLRELADANSMRAQMAELATRVNSVQSAAAMIAGQNGAMEEARRLIESSRIPAYLQEFERVNRHWVVPSAVLGISGAFRVVQDRLGKVTLPTIDMASARALFEMLGREGVEDQLSLVGIKPDGSMQPAEVPPERGLLSRRQSDQVAPWGLGLGLLSLLITLLVFVYQEMSSAEDKAKAEDAQRAQALKIQHLTELVEKSLLAAAQVPQERFVVRGRVATVRAKPEHGAVLEGKLLPNEVVRAIGQRGKWVQVEYYHWAAGEYRIGWVLKHYLERVPANHAARSGQRPSASR